MVNRKIYSIEDVVNLVSCRISVFLKLVLFPRNIWLVPVLLLLVTVNDLTLSIVLGVMLSTQQYTCII